VEGTPLLVRLQCRRFERRNPRQQRRHHVALLAAARRYARHLPQGVHLVLEVRQPRRAFRRLRRGDGRRTALRFQLAG